MNAPGDIVYAANTLLTCPATAGNCAAAQAGTRASANNEFAMIQVDTDSDASTFNSSTATLDIPADATVLFAGLYWGAVSTSGDRGTVQFETGTGTGYTTVTADQLDDRGATYQGFADVTAAVQATGNGEYTVANVRTRTGRNRHAGWSLVVAYESPSAPWRNLTVFDGFELVNPSNPVDVTVSGFIAPPTGPVNARIGMIAYEGDARYSGDFAEFEGTPFGDGLNPPGNFFNSAITDAGVSVPGRDPDYVDQLGYDAKIIATSGLVAPSATSANISLRSAGDWYYPGVITSAIDVFVPNLSSDFDKTVTDLNGGQVHPGDELEYVVEFSNQGGDAALDTVITDDIPAGTTYSPGSLVVLDGDNPGAKSDAGGDDQASFAGGMVTFNIGTGATAIDGGRVAPFSQTGQRYRVRFRVTVDDTTPDGFDVDNVAASSYTAETLGLPYTSQTPTVTVPVVALSDLSFESKTDSADPIVAGGDVAYTLTIRNDGPSTAENVSITDTLPAGVTFNPTGSTGTCTESGGVVTCTLGSVPVGTASATIVVTVDEDATVGTLNNSATVSSTTTDTDPTDNTATETTTIERLVDLALTKVATPAPDVAGEAVAGGQISYVLTLTNNGPSSATNATITDALPVGTTVASTAPSGAGTCSSASGSIACTWPSIATGATVTVTVVVDVASSLGATDTVTNQASASADEPEDPAGAPQTATARVDIARQIDLQVTKTSASPAVAGEVATFDIEITNAGPSDATNVQVVDTLPAGTTFVAGQSSGSCLPDSATQVTCSTASLPAGSTVNFTVAVEVPSDAVAGAPLTNQAAASATEPENPATTADNTDAAIVAITRSADLSIAKNHVAEPVAAGGPVAWTITVTNRGPSEATGVTVTDTLPSSVAFAASPGCTEAGGIVTCTAAGPLAAGDDVTFTVNGTVDAGAADGSVLTNSARVDANEPDPQPDNNETSVGTQVNRVAALDIFKRETAGSPDPVIAGDPISWEIEVINRGPSIATGVAITDDLSGLPVTVTGATGPGCSVTAGEVNCSQATLAVNASILVTVTATTSSALANGAVILNTATASGDASPAVSASEETSVLTSADLQLQKIGPTSLFAGEVGTFELTLLNAGPSDATGVTIDDLLPAGFAYDAFRVTAGAATCAPAGGNVECTVGALAAGASVVVEIDATADSSLAVGDMAINRAVADADQPDPDPSSNTAEATTTIAREADLLIVKSDPVGSSAAGEGIVYEIVVDNLGPSDATNVEVTDVLPVNTTFDPGASSGVCSEAGGTVTCALGTIDPQAGPTTISIAVIVDAGFTGPSITNAAGVNATENDPVADNDTDDAVTAIETRADLAIVKTSPATPPVPGTNYTYTVQVSNAGPSIAADVSVTDTLPAGTTFVSSSLGASCTSGATEVECQLGAVGLGAATSFSITVAVDPGATGSIANTAVVDSSTPDPTPGDNTSTDTSALLTRADLSLAKSAVVPTVVAGTNATFELVVSNAGPSDATGIVVTDLLPPTLAFDATLSDARCADTGGGAIECSDAGPIAPGSSLTFTLVAQVDTSVAAGARLSNSAVVDADTDDPDESNNTGSATVDIERSADISLTKVAAEVTITAGSDATFTLTATNNGPSDATTVVVQDTLPAGMTLVSATPGAGGSCTTTPTSVTCTATTLAVGASFEIVVVAKSAPDVPDAASLVNSATVTAAEPDPDTSNNTATAPVSVNRIVNLSVAKSASAQPIAVAGEPQAFEIVVENTGLSNATGVTITDPLPVGSTFYAAGSAANCAEAGGVVSCLVGDLPAGQSTAFVISFIVDQSTADGGSIINTASVSSNEPDTDSTDDSSTVDVPVVRRADVFVRKQGSPDPVVAGTSTSFTLSYGNAGPSDATGLVITDVLPAGVTFDAGSSDARCSAIGPTVTCAVGDVAVGAATTPVLIGVLLDGGLAEGAMISNTATVLANEPDPLATNNESTNGIQVRRDSALELIKTDLTDPVLAGNDVTYRLEVINRGPSTVDDVVIVDALPPGTSVQSIPPGCTASGAFEVTCDAGQLIDGARATFDVVLTVDSDLADGAQITNSASASGATGAGAMTQEETTIARLADISVQKQTTTPTVTAGVPVVYELTVTNDGPSDATNLVMTDVLPGSAQVIRVSAPTGTCVETVGQVTCAWPTFAAGASEVIEIELVPEAFLSAGVPFDNRAVVSADETDPDLTNNATLDEQVIDRSVDLSLTKVATSPTVVAGGLVNWTLTVSNAGPSFAADVVITDPLPAGVTFSVDGSSAACAADAANLVTCAVGTVPAAGTAEVTIAATVDASLPLGTQLTNVATVSSPEPNLNTDPTATSTVDVSTGADLVVTKQLVSDAVVAGEDVTYEITLRNDGPSNALGIELSDRLPGGLTVDTPPSDCTMTDGRLVCAVATLAVGDSIAVTVTGALDPGASGSLINQAMVQSDTDDPDATNNVDTVEVPIERVADLGVTKATTTEGTIAAGGALDWQIVVTNAGPSTATEVQLFDNLPDTLIVGTLPTGCAANGQQVTCELADLGVGESTTLVIGTTVADGAAGATIENTVSVSSAETDPNPVDDDAQANINVAPNGAGDDGPLPRTGSNSSGLVALGAALLAAGAGFMILAVRRSNPAPG